MLDKLTEQIDHLIRTVSLNEIRGLSKEGRSLVLEKLEDIKYVLQIANGDKWI
jgi:hypothetical protein